jgi:hypothetical protein
MKAHQDEGGGIILLVNKRGKGAVTAGRVTFLRVLKFEFQLDSLVKMRIVQHTYIQIKLKPELTERDYFLSRGYNECVSERLFTPATSAKIAYSPITEPTF